MSNSELTSVYAQGSIEEFRHDGDDHDNKYLPARSMAFVPKDPNGLFVFPDHPDVRLYVEQLSVIYDELGIPPRAHEPIMVPDVDYLLDECIRQNIEYLESGLNRDQAYRVFPYATTETTLEWINRLQERGFNVSSALPQRTYYEDLRSPSHRAGWARTIHQPDELSFPERYGIPYPLSFVGTGLDEVLQAYKLLCERTGNNNAFFKPAFSAGGFTLKRITNSDELKIQFDHVKAQGALDILGGETPIEIQEEIQDIVGLCALHYEGERIVSPNILTKQIVKGLSYAGNIFNPGLDPKLLAQGEQIFRRFAHGIHEYTGQKLQGWGGLDIAIVLKNGQQSLQVIEHNGQRINGGHPAIALAEGFGVTSPFMMQKSPGDPTCDLATLQNILTTSHLAYDDQRKRGVFPIIWMRGSGMLWVAGSSEKDMQGLLDRTYNKLSQEDLIETS